MALIRTLRPGDCMTSIAFEHGFAPDTLWKHPRNARLHDEGRKPNQLRPGDEVFVPEAREKQVKAATGARHRFRRRGVPARFRVRLLDANGRPRSGLAYTLAVDGAAHDGTTTDAGEILQWISPCARQAQLVLHTSEGDETYVIALGEMTPITDVAGVKARLRALGYPCEIDDQDNEVLRGVLKRFQTDEGLEPTGERDGGTLARLEERYGS
jgi:hypothetical protein